MEGAQTSPRNINPKRVIAQPARGYKLARSDFAAAGGKREKKCQKGGNVESPTLPACVVQLKLPLSIRKTAATEPRLPMAHGKLWPPL